MASTVEVVLKENLEHLGSIGDVVKVRRGYARNFLLPRGLAVVASRGNVKQVEHEKAVQAQRIAKLRAEQEDVVEQLSTGIGDIHTVDGLAVVALGPDLLEGTGDGVFW